MTELESAALPSLDGGGTRGSQQISPDLLGDIRRSTPSARRDVDHWHDDVEFDLVTRGTGAYVLDEHVYDIAPGTLIWHLPGQRHKLIRTPALEQWVVMFRPALLQEAWLSDLAAQPSRVISNYELIDLDRLMSQVAQDSDEAATYNAGLSYVVMRALRASRDRPSAADKSMHPAVARALMLMRTQDNQDSLSDLAAKAGIAAPYLSRLMIDHTGRTFVDWRNRIRLDRFMVGYRPGENLLALALEAGFGSYNRFNHVFRELIGCCPSDWVAKVADGGATPKVGVALPVSGYGIQAAGLLSARQRWTSLAPLTSPAITAVLGDRFAKQLLAAGLQGPSSAAEMLDAPVPNMSSEDFDELCKALGREDPMLAADYARILATHDTQRIFRQLFGLFDPSVPGLCGIIAGALGMAWMIATRQELTPGEAAAVRRQVESVVVQLPRIAAERLREAHVALRCHYVILFHANQAARASGDRRHMDEVRSAARTWSKAAFGCDPVDLRLTADGFVSRSGIDT
jgi:AraC-like DNA-binding protein